MKSMVGFCVVGALGALFVSGCANKEIVQKDEAISPTISQKKQTDVKVTKNGSAENTAPGKTSANGVGKDGVMKGSGKEMTSKVAPQSNEQLTSALEKIYFDFNSDALSDQARKTLTSNADYLRKRAVAKLRIEGNCDERGSAEYNIALGEKRAEVAKKYLVTLGIPADRLAIISYGKEKPADPGHDESAWAKNRRDEFTILAN